MRTATGVSPLTAAGNQYGQQRSAPRSAVGRALFVGVLADGVLGCGGVRHARPRLEGRTQGAVRRRRDVAVMLLNGKPKSERPKLRKGYKPPRLTRQLKWALEDLEELVLARRLTLAYDKFVEITRLEIIPDKHQYSDLILLMGMIGVEDAELVLEDMKRRELAVGIDAMNEIIKVHGRRRDPAGIWATLRRIDGLGLPVNGNTIWAMVEGFVKANDPDGGRAALEEMRRRKLTNQEGSFLARMRYCSFMGDVDGVEEAFFEMTEKYGFFPTPYAYNLRIASFADQGEAFAAEETLQEMRVLARLKPNETTYSLLIKMYVQAEDIERAQATFELMQSEGLAVKSRTFAQLRRGMRRQQELETLENILLDLKRNRFGGLAFLSGFEALRSHVSGRYRSAWSAFVAVKSMLQYDIDPRGDTYLAVFAPAVEAQLLRAPDLVRAEMEAGGVRPEQFFFTCLIDAYHKLEQPQFALDALSLQEEHGVQPTLGTINVVVASYCRRDKASVALRWLAFLLRNGVKPSPKAFAYVGCACCSDDAVAADLPGLLALMKQFDVPWHNRLIECLQDAKQRGVADPWKDVKLPSTTDALPVDDLGGKDFETEITSSPPEEISVQATDGDHAERGTGAAELKGSETEAVRALLNDPLPEVHEHLILSKATELILSSSRSGASDGSGLAEDSPADDEAADEG